MNSFSLKTEPLCLTPNWPKPPNVHAYTTTRCGGYSEANYHSFNLGDHVGDQPQHVQTNRELLMSHLHLPNEPFWLEQTHSNRVVIADQSATDQNADASITRTANTVCTILTADCLPILLTNIQGTEVAAIHAGWRGLANGIIKNSIEKMHSPPNEILAWLGPAIGGSKFEVGQEVYQQFTSQNPSFAAGFAPHQQGKWLANLFVLASLELYRLGIMQIFSENLCTYNDPTRFFSYRRDGQTGRMATLIWFE